MKIDRRIGILSLLLQKDIITAPFLAEHFEVSRRTINQYKQLMEKSEAGLRMS